MMNNHSDTGTPQQNKTQRLILLLPIVLLLSILPAKADDDDKSQCHAFYGPFTSEGVPTPARPSPAEL